MSAATDDLTRQGHWQIEALCTALLNAARMEDTDGLEHTIRAIVLRIIEVNGAMMFVTHDKDIEDFKRTILGVCA